jgi:hypothetical protein
MKLVFRIAATAMMAVACAMAQSSGGATLQGTVKDSTGAVIPNAKVISTHVETGVKTSTVSNNEGYFVFPPSQIGKYRVRCEATGMKAWEEDVVLETGKTTDVNPVLALGDVSQTVLVSADVPMITTNEPTDSTTLDQQRIKELPINGRDLNTLIMDVTPGIEYGGNVNDGARTGGMMTYSTTYSQDGASANNREFGGSTGLQGLESVGEVRIETSTGNAKSSSPASVIVTTRGGTNRWTTSLYETARNNCCGVAKHLQDVNTNGTPFKLPKLIRNEYGGSFGGPVMLPTFGLNGKKVYNGRNRTFFFVSKEEVSLRQGLTYSFSVPTVAQRQGNFSGLETNTGLPITIYDPQSGQVQTLTRGPVTIRTPFPNNTIPVTRESPLAKYIYNITPLPSDSIIEPNIAPNLKYSIGNSSLPNATDNPIVIRVDHRFTNRDNFFAKANWDTRLSWFLGTTSLSSLYVPTTGGEANVTYLPMQAWGGALSETHVFSSTLFVETLLNKTWQTTKTINGAPDAQQNWAAVLGLPNPYGQIGWPNIQTVGTNFTQYIEGDNRRFLSSGIMNLQQNYTWIKNNHTLGFGGGWHDEVERLQPDQGNISGTATFNSLATALESTTAGSTGSPSTIGNTGFDAANFFLGEAATYSVYLSRGVMKIDQRNGFLYAQDNWRVNGRLTLTPGLRWDINPAWTDSNHLLNTFDVKNHAVVLAEPLSYYIANGSTTPQVAANFQKVGVKIESAQDAGLNSNFFPSNLKDFGPRMGVAYRFLEGRKAFVLRGGYGLYISGLPLRTLLAQFSSQLPFKATFQYNPNSSAYSPDGNNSYLLTHTSPIVAGLNSSNVVDITNPNSLGVGQSITAMSPNMPSSKVQQWNIELEKELGHSLVMRLRYDGKHGSDLDQLDNINPQQTDYLWYSSTLLPTPTGTYSSVARRPYDQTAYTTINFLSKTGVSNSVLLSAELDKRFSRGLQFQWFYTLTNAYRLAGNSFRDSPGTTAAQFAPGAVPTDFNALNRFLNYARDTGVPQHRVRWNWIYQLPFGHGQQFAPNAPKWLQAMIGGWSLTGSGTVVSTWFGLDASDWGFTGAPVQVYGKKYPIEDCTATPASAKSAADERCYQAYYYWNGYISPNRINSVNANGIPNGYIGVPSGITPAVHPLVPYGAPGAVTGDYDTNVVYIKLTNGTNQRVTYDTGLNPFRNQYRLGPFNWVMDSSMRKTFRFAEGGKANLRVSVDVFNVLNNQGLNTPGSNGVVNLANSFSGYGFQPRQVQGGFRLEF